MSSRFSSTGLFSRLILIWTLVGLVFAVQLYLFAQAGGWKTTWAYIVWWELCRWWLWIPLTPIVFRMAARYPIRRNILTNRLLTHLPASIAVSLIHVALFSAIQWMISDVGKGLESGEPFSAALANLFSTGTSEPVRMFRYIFSLDFHFGIFVYWLLLALRQTIDSHNRVTNLELELNRAQLQALHMQLHPHFLFNTLNSISALLHRNPEAADEMIGSLGDLLRTTLGNLDVEEVTLEKELDFLRSYLEIEQARFGERLRVNFDIDPESLPARIPKLILQPIIENAIRHGIGDRPEPGWIEITAKRLNGRLQATVVDNGPGVPSENGGWQEGIGLRNTRARLDLSYGGDYRLILTNIPAGGLKVLIEIPFRTSDARGADSNDTANTNIDR